jgi:MFS family permease
MDLREWNLSEELPQLDSRSRPSKESISIGIFGHSYSHTCKYPPNFCNIELISNRTIAMMGYGNTYFNLWLKAEGYSVVNVNTIPTAGAALGIIAALTAGIYADRTGNRKTTVTIVIIIVTVGNVLLTVWRLPSGVLMFANFLTFVVSAAQPIIIVSKSPCHFKPDSVLTSKI